MTSENKQELTKELEGLEKLKALYDFLAENNMDLQACSCCYAISIYWNDELIADDIKNISELKDFIELEEKRLNETRKKR